MPDRMVFLKKELTGGGADALDNISAIDRGDGNPLADDDAAFVMASGTFYAYMYDEDETDAESSPSIIKPDDVDGADPGRWVQQSISTGFNIADYLVIADIDDTPVDSETSAPISSNWAYDHVAAADPHPGYQLESGMSAYLAIANIDDSPVDSETSAPISSNWAYDHENAADPHGGYVLESAKGDVDPTPADDHSITGPQATMTAGENLTIGQLCYLKSDGKWWKAKADAIGTMPGMAIAAASITADEAGVFALPGAFVRDDTWNWTTLGGFIYVSEATAGVVTQSAPATTGNQVQIIGIAYTADIIMFNPSPVIVEVA